jgi:hypothetical protein
MKAAVLPGLVALPRLNEVLMVLCGNTAIWKAG